MESLEDELWSRLVASSGGSNIILHLEVPSWHTALSSNKEAQIQLGYHWWTWTYDELDSLAYHDKAM